MNLVADKFGLEGLGESDVLDVGCGVRFTQAIINRGIPIRSYTGIDVFRPLIEHLQREVDDPRFSFAHWDAQNAKYNPGGVKITAISQLPVQGDFDLIWLFSVFTHLYPSDANALLAILRRHIRPGGGLFFSAFLDDTVDSFEDKLPDQPLAHPCYSERYLKELVVANGWRISSVSPPSPKHFIQHYFVCYPAMARP